MSNDAEKNWQGVLTINNNTSYKIDWFFTSGLGAVKHTKGHTIMTIQPGNKELLTLLQIPLEVLIVR